MLKPLFKGLGALLGLALIAGVIFVVNLIWFRPWSLNLFYEKIFVSFVLDQPELLSSLGIAESVGYRAHNAHLDDLSEAKGDRDFARLRRYREELAQYPIEKQSPDQQLSTRVLARFLDEQVEGERWRHHNYPVNQLFGVQNGTAEFLMEQHRITDRRGAEDYIARLSEVGRKFDQVIEGLKIREAKGVIPPRFVIERVLTEMKAFIAREPHPLVKNLTDKLAKVDGLSDAEKQALIERGSAQLKTSVIPAYQRLIAFFEAQLPKSTTDDGVWKLPDGAAYYAYLLRSQTTTTYSPEELHQIGLKEVARIEGEMADLLRSQQEVKAGETPQQALARLAKDPRFLYPNTEAGRQQALADYSRMVDEQLKLSRQVIGLSPKAGIEVRRIAEFKDKTAPGAYYNPPAMDGSRPGVFYANLRDMAEVPKFGMRTLAIHEGVPGHHFQIALAMEQSGGPTFRKVLPFTAYMEGWALYTEWLGLELGVYKDDPFGNLGRLQDEMMRAVRLVVDTGIHAKHWTRDQAIDYMEAKTGMVHDSVVSEIERYIVNPGQACAYKVGMLSLQAARERAQKALGTRWNAQAERDFHDVVLRHGALPLSIVDEQVDAWIKHHP